MTQNGYIKEHTHKTKQEDRYKHHTDSENYRYSWYGWLHCSMTDLVLLTQICSFISHSGFLKTYCWYTVQKYNQDELGLWLLDSNNNLELYDIFYRTENESTQVIKWQHFVEMPSEKKTAICTFVYSNQNVSLHKCNKYWLHTNTLSSSSVSKSIKTTCISTFSITKSIAVILKLPLQSNHCYKLNIIEFTI